jgi:hypothetical protein
MVFAGAGTSRQRESAVFQLKSVSTLLGPDPPAGSERVLAHTDNGTVAKIQKTVRNAFSGQKVPDRFQGKTFCEAPEIKQKPAPGQSGFMGLGEKFIGGTGLATAECRYVEVPVSKLAEFLTKFQRKEEILPQRHTA